MELKMKNFFKELKASLQETKLAQYIQKYGEKSALWLIITAMIFGPEIGRIFGAAAIIVLFLKIVTR